VGRQVINHERPWKVHPIWNAIGCLFLILIPILAYTGATLLVEANVEAKWIAVSNDLMRTIRLPVLGLEAPHFLANLLAAGVLILLGYGLLMVIYAALYSIIGPEKYSPLDSPPIKRSSKQSWLKK
jgi:hypothetical protein